MVPGDIRDVALVSQMRAGTHYMCAALRLGLAATLLRPRDGGAYGPMDDDYILKDLHADSNFRLPPVRDGHSIYFSHYYHPHHRALRPMPRVSLIGFPLDSFYSDGVVYSDKEYSAGPSASRAHASEYVMRYASKEWAFLEERMHQNAQWLGEIGKRDDDMVVRYEDLSGQFNDTIERISRHLGGFVNPVPPPIINKKRTYWTRDFHSKFDTAALKRLTKLFAPAVRRFYPECSEILTQD